MYLLDSSMCTNCLGIKFNSSGWLISPMVIYFTSGRNVVPFEIRKRERKYNNTQTCI